MEKEKSTKFLAQVNPAADWKNDGAREAWLERYEDWGLFAETPELGLKFYRVDLGAESKEVDFYFSNPVNYELTIIALEQKSRAYYRQVLIDGKHDVTYFLCPTSEIEKGVFAVEYPTGKSKACDVLKQLKVLAVGKLKEDKK